MTPYEQFRLAVYLFGIPIIVGLLVRAVRKTREIRALHEKLRAEEDAGQVRDPYAAMADAFTNKK